MTWTQWITFALAVLGAGLGAFNTVVAYRRGSPRLSIIEDYQPLERTFSSPPRYEIRVENRGNAPIALQRVEVVFQAKQRRDALTIYEGEPSQDFVIEPHRVEKFSLPGHAFFSLPTEGKAWIEIKTEASGMFRRRAREIWVFAAEYAEMAAVAHAGSRGPTNLF